MRFRKNTKHRERDEQKLTDLEFHIDLLNC